MEFLPFSLQEILDLGISIEQSQIKWIFKEIVKGVQYTHSRNLIHRDLKLPNILVEIDSQSSLISILKIADFGLCRSNMELSTRFNFCGTPNYMAPEMFNRNGNYDKRVDTWSLGIILHTLLF